MYPKTPIQDCEGKCEDNNICPKRQGEECKDGIECIYYPSNSCEFLHTDTLLEEYREHELDALKIISHGYGARLSFIERQLLVLDNMSRDATQSIKALEEKLYEKVTILESKIQELETKRLDTNNECNKTNDGDKKIETRTTGLQPENIVDTVSHKKRN